MHSGQHTSTDGLMRRWREGEREGEGGGWSLSGTDFSPQSGSPGETVKTRTGSADQQHDEGE